jgi:Fe2+ transport system protein FeoA
MINPKKTGLIQRLLLKLKRTPRCEAKLCPAGIFALVNLPCGACGLVRKLDLSPEAANRLRQIGIREGCQIALLSRNDPMLVSVDNARIALASQLCQHIEVESL